VVLAFDAFGWPQWFLLQEKPGFFGRCTLGAGAVFMTFTTVAPLLHCSSGDCGTGGTGDVVQDFEISFKL
jgi:hypothetical protein